MRYTANLPYDVMERFSYMLERSVDPGKDYFISISSGGPRYPRIITPILENTHFAEFWDIPEEGEPESFSESQAKDMADFIRKVKAKDANLWVNCHAGISRSGAVVETLILLGWTDLEHYRQETRYPNPLVFKRLTNHFPELMMPTPPMTTAEWDWKLTQRANRYAYFND